MREGRGWIVDGGWCEDGGGAGAGAGAGGMEGAKRGNARAGVVVKERGENNGNWIS